MYLKVVKGNSRFFLIFVCLDIFLMYIKLEILCSCTVELSKCSMTMYDICEQDKNLVYYIKTGESQSKG